jgi:hypothetical protein
MVGSLFDKQRLRLEQRTKNLRPSGAQEALHGSPRHAHALSRRLLVASFEIAEAHRLELAQFEADGLQLAKGDAPRLEDAVAEIGSAEPPFAGSWHWRSPV